MSEPTDLERVAQEVATELNRLASSGMRRGALRERIGDCARVLSSALGRAASDRLTAERTP